MREAELHRIFAHESASCRLGVCLEKYHKLPLYLSWVCWHKNMLILEFKIKAKPIQYGAIDEAIRTTQFIRNKCLRFWMDNKKVSKYDLNKYSAVLANEFSFADKRWLNG